ncbi:YciI family protein [Antrihabitans sp. YC2-6]|uniref:YciI family protein n=1 Tax=Antrihabitans sp. YC2-6 TaxID=2799498 RepID=UPI0018F78AC0|nr:YciI family protein [Antrihabitans sp. YC2-6]MBJ8343785.1 hypothetical protein [Antrihabitans sp. YC2-6]
MKYMIMMFGDAAPMLEQKSPEWIRGMIAFMQKIGEDLTASGELAGGEGLVDSTQAKKIHVVDGISIATDGPFAEAKESLIGYWIVDVESEARAIEIGKEIVDFTKEPLEIRRVADGPPEI